MLFSISTNYAQVFRRQGDQGRHLGASGQLPPNKLEKNIVQPMPDDYLDMNLSCPPPNKMLDLLH